MRTLRMSRQLYDLGKMMDAAIDKEALTDKELYNILIRHRAWYIRISWMDYATLQPDTMKGQIIYGEAEEFGRLIERLMTLNENFPNTGK